MLCVWALEFPLRSSGFIGSTPGSPHRVAPFLLVVVLDCTEPLYDCYLSLLRALRGMRGFYVLLGKLPNTKM